jgi:DNA modification methylase
MSKVKDQVHEENYSIYNADCMDVLPTLADESVDLSVYSPPFHNLYTYSSDIRDLSNCDSMSQFLNQYEFIVEELARVTKKGRINAIHITDICEVSGTLHDFPHYIIELYKKHGFEYKNRITVWKEPLKVRIKTMVKSLMHKYIIEDSMTADEPQLALFLIYTSNQEETYQRIIDKIESLFVRLVESKG